MDLPLVLEKLEMVESALEEKKQEIEVCLKQAYGSILQNYRKGTNVSEMTTKNVLRSEVIQTMSQIENISNVSVRVSDDGIVDVSFTFRGNKESMTLEYDNGKLS